MNARRSPTEIGGGCVYDMVQEQGQEQGKATILHYTHQRARVYASWCVVQRGVTQFQVAREKLKSDLSAEAWKLPCIGNFRVAETSASRKLPLSEHSLQPRTPCNMRARRVKTPSNTP